MIELNIGQNRFHFSSLNSTNQWVLEMVKDSILPDGLLVSTDFQTKGRGAMGNYWESKPGENVLITVLLKSLNLEIKDQFDLNKLVSVAICDYLISIGIDAEIKWPNDVLVKGKKIAGILIQNSIMGTKIKHAVVGIGLNVNQIEFELFKRLPTSVLLETKQKMVISNVIDELIRCLNFAVSSLKVKSQRIPDQYLLKLFQKDIECEYLYKDVKLKGTIGGITPNGNLIMSTENGEQLIADLKEIEYL